MNIISAENGRVEGDFQTVLEQSGFFGQTVPLVGVCMGDLISVSCACRGKKRDMAVSFTGMLVKGRLQTLWHLVTDDRDKASEDKDTVHNIMTNADIFEHIS